MPLVETYQNKRNPHKYIEVRRYKDGHITARQYMFFKDKGIKNYLGSRTGRLFRFRKKR